MFLKLNDDLKQSIIDLVLPRFEDQGRNDTELKIGLEAMEKLLKIDNDTYTKEENETSNPAFDEEYAEGTLDKLKFYEVKDENIIPLCRVEGMLKKISIIKGQSVYNEDGKYMMLNDFYGKIGFYRWLRDLKAREAIAKEGGHFQLGDANAELYKECPNFLYDYIVAYQIRNGRSHDERGRNDPLLLLNKLRSLFVVYIDQCYRNKDVINEAYQNDELSELDYYGYANDLFKQMKDFDEDFIQLGWTSEDNSIFDYSSDSMLKFIGEAGSGKTTQMKKMYINMLSEVAKKKKQIIPVWISLAEIGEYKSKPIQEKAEQIIDGVGGDYQELLKSGKIAFFLDGFNEILSQGDDNQRKKDVAREVNKDIATHNNVFVAMTDRIKISNPSCLNQIGVKVYRANGMSKEEIREYLNHKARSDDEKNKVTEYLESSDAQWLFDAQSIIPEKMNGLFEMIIQGDIPKKEYDFYVSYLNHIFYRESNEKQEMRINNLKYLLGLLPEKMTSINDELKRSEILAMWIDKGRVSLDEANQMIDLAIELPILIEGSNQDSLKFVNGHYYLYFENYGG